MTKFATTSQGKHILEFSFFFLLERQSRSQSPQAFLSAVGRLERPWGNGIEVRQDFWRKTIGRYTKQPIKKRYFSRFPQSLQATNR